MITLRHAKAFPKTFVDTSADAVCRVLLFMKTAELQPHDPKPAQLRSSCDLISDTRSNTLDKSFLNCKKVSLMSCFARQNAACLAETKATIGSRDYRITLLGPRNNLADTPAPGLKFDILDPI